MGGLSTLAGLGDDHSQTTGCNWSYGFRERATKKIADIVIGFRRRDQKLGCYVIETKRPGGKLSEKDLDPQYYLGFEHIVANAEHRRMIYCVDPVEASRARSLLESDPGKYRDCGVTTWEEIAGLQITLAKCLDVSSQIRSFVAGAIQYQFAEHGLHPSVVSEPYLAEEPSVADVYEGLKTPYDNHDPQWTEVPIFNPS